MALDTKLTSNVDLNVNGTAVQNVMDGFGKALQDLLNKIEKIGATGVKGGDATVKSYNNLLRQFEQLEKRARTVQGIMESGRNKATQNVTNILNDNSLGKRAADAARMSKELNTTVKSAEVLSGELIKINKQFADMARAGQLPNRAQLNRQLGLEEALKQMRELERLKNRLDSRALLTSSGGTSGPLAGQRIAVNTAFDAISSAARDGRRSNFQEQINGARALITEYQKLIALELKETEIAANRAALAVSGAQTRAGFNEAQLRARVQAAGRQFAIDPTSARAQATPEGLARASANYERSAIRLARAKVALDQAVQAGTPPERLERLNRIFDTLVGRMALAEKQQRAINKAFQDLPEQKAQRARDAIKQTLFGDGGAAFASRIGGAALISTGVFAAINSVKDGVRFVIEFESALKQLQAISGSTDTELQKVAISIGAVAANSNYSTIEITKAATTLAQAGFTVSEISKSLKDVAVLSAASGSDPTQSVDVLTSALGAFQLQAGETGRIANVLVAALNQTKLTIDQVAAGIQYAGATAHENGVRFEELVAIMGSMANAGVRSGSTIGTGIRQLLVDLQTPTEKLKNELKAVGLTMADIDVRTQGFAGVVRNLAEAGFTASAAYEGLEVRAAAAYLAFKNQLPVYDQLQKSIVQSNAAAEAQAKTMDSLDAQWQRLKNNLGNVASRVFAPIVAILKTAAVAVNGLIEAIDSLNSSVGGQGGALGAILSIIAGAGAGAMVGGPWGALVGGVIAAVSAFGDLTSKLEEVRTATSEATANAKAQEQTYYSVNEAIDSLIDRKDVLSKNEIALQTETLTLTDRFNGLQEIIWQTGSSYDGLLEAMNRYETQAAANFERALKRQEAAMKTQLATEKAAAAQSSEGTTLYRWQRGTPGWQSNFGPKMKKAATTLANRNATTDQLRAAIDDLDSIENLQQIRGGPALYDSLLQAYAAKANVDALQDGLSAVGTQIGIAHARQSRPAQSANRAANDLRATANTQIEAFERTGSKKNLQQAIDNAKGGVSGLDKQIGSYGAEDPMRIVLQGERDRMQSDIQRMERLLRPTKAEQSAARAYQRDEGKAAQLNREEAEATINRILKEAKAGSKTVEGEGGLRSQLNNALGQFSAASLEEYAKENQRMDPGLFAKGKDALRGKIAEQVKGFLADFYKATADVIIKASEAELQKINDTAADKAFTAAGGVRSAQDRLDAANLPENRNVVGDGTRFRLQRDLEDAQRSNRAEANRIELDRITQSKAELDAREAKINATPDSSANGEQKTKNLNDIKEARRALNLAEREAIAIQQSINAESEKFSNIPMFDRLRNAAAFWAEQSGAAQDWATTIENSVSPILDTLAQQFATLFEKIISGSQSVGAALKSFAKAMVSAMVQIIAKAIAMQAVLWILEAVGLTLGKGPGGGTVITKKQPPAAPSYNAFTGAYIRRAQGGPVTNGLKTRDSVHAMLAKGEYVVRSSAVDSVGVDFMNDLNSRGAKALRRANNMNLVMPSAKQETNVYVVKENQRPQMGPNDVLLVIADDILQGGQTKKLIRTVAQGG